MSKWIYKQVVSGAWSVIDDATGDVICNVKEEKDARRIARSQPHTAYLSGREGNVMRCARCGQEDVLLTDCSAKWSEENGEWLFYDAGEDYLGYCNSCDEPTTITETEAGAVDD